MLKLSKTEIDNIILQIRLSLPFKTFENKGKSLII